MYTVHYAPTAIDPIIGVGNPQRLRAVAAAELCGHINDPDLNAVVGTLRLACGVPIAVINIVKSNLQVTIQVLRRAVAVSGDVGGRFGHDDDGGGWQGS